MQQQADNIVSYKSEYEKIEDEMEYCLNHHVVECRDEALMTNPIAYKASTNPDVMYYHKAMEAPGSKQFTQAIIDEVNAHVERDHWEMIPTNYVPEGEIILDSV